MEDLTYERPGAGHLPVEQVRSGPSRAEVAADVAAAIDRVLSRPVLVVGSPPPDGTDLDLLARPEDARAIRHWLEQAGFVAWGHTWARFDSPGPYAVELSTTERWRSGQDDSSWLFHDAEPLPGLHHLLLPSPATTLVLAARSIITRRGRISDKITRRVSQALERDPQAWSVAEERARPVGMLGPLRLLREAHRSGPPTGPWTRAAGLARALFDDGSLRGRARILLAARPRRLRPAVISFSGLDGSGKSTQAGRLQETLREVGVSSQMQWAGFKSGRVFLSFVPFLDRPIGAKRHPERAPDRLIPPAFRHTSTGRQAWALIVVLGNAVHLWRLVLRRRSGNKVLIFDRFSPDTTVKLDLWFHRDRGIDIGWQRRLFTAISPKPDVGYLVDVSTQVAYGRRQEETLEELANMSELYQEQVARFGLQPLDGMRSPDDLCRQVAVTAWRGLR